MVEPRIRGCHSSGKEVKRPYGAEAQINRGPAVHDRPGPRWLRWPASIRLGRPTATATRSNDGRTSWNPSHNIVQPPPRPVKTAKCAQGIPQAPPPPARPQLPMADIAQATEPDFWDGVDLATIGVERAQEIAGWRPGDRMLATLSLDVSNTAKVVAAAIAFHGWTGWPGLDRLAELTRTAKPHVSRATKELELAGILVKTRRHHKAGHVGIQYSFSGRAIAEALDFRAGKNGNGTITNMVTAEGTDASAKIARATNSAITNMVMAEGCASAEMVMAGDYASAELATDTDSAITNMVTAEGCAGENLEASTNSAITNMVTEPEFLFLLEQKEKEERKKKKERTALNADEGGDGIFLDGRKRKKTRRPR